jgi:2-C-methyl-D-erythritol 4-phosphate cytidylyltransferase
VPDTTDSTRHFAVIPAAGSGSRMGGDLPKQYLPIGERTVLELAVAPFVDAGWVSAVLVVVAPGDTAAAALPGLRHERVHVVDAGGATRRSTVLAGLRWLGERLGALPEDWVHVHDAARPGLERDALERLRLALAGERIGALLALPIVDTVKRGPTGRVDATVERDGLWLAQTPQAFRHGMLARALDRHHRVTDEASAIEATGHRPALVEGSRRNFKVTTADDLATMRVLMRDGHSR